MVMFACHTWSFNDLTLPEALATVARLGFRAVDIGSGANLNAARAAENPRKLAGEIRADLDLFNLALTDIYLLLPRISALDDVRRQKDIDLFKALLPFAQALRTPGVTVSPGLMQPGKEDESYDRARAALLEMNAAAEKAGLRLSIEPHLDSVAATPDQVRKLLDDVHGLELTLDWAHLVCQDIFHEQIVELLPHARHIQMRQAARAQLQTPFERGRIDARKVMQAVELAGYEGAISIEYLHQPGWHGALPVNTLVESVKMRDALRAARL